MIASCSNCKTQFNIPDAKIPDKGARVRCARCKEYFIVKKDNKSAKKAKRTVVENPSPPPPPKVEAPPPPPNEEAPPPSPPGESGETEEVEESFVGSPVEECKKGTPAWIMTFADLATLMLTFFVLLLSFANMDIVKFQEMLGSVQDAFGVQRKVKGKFQSVLKGDEAPSEAVSAAEEKAKDELERQKISQKVEDVAKSLKQSDKIAVSVTSDGVKVRIKGNYFFNPGSSQLKKESLKFLNSISTMLKEFPFKLTVEGHTDSIPISTAQFPSNWELSSFRATTVLRYFAEQKDIDPSRLTAIGYASNKPIASNEEASGRAQNRRVEFVFSKK